MNGSTELKDTQISHAASDVGSIEALVTWANELSMADLDQASKALSDTIHKVITDIDDANAQLQAFDVLRLSVKKICGFLGSCLIDKCVSLSDDKNGFSTLFLMLHFKLFNGYKQTIKQFESQGDHSLIAQAVHRSISEALDLVLFQYQMYTSIDAQLWADINQMYALAERLDIHAVPVEDAHPETPNASSILQVMLRIQLLSLCKPYALRREDLYLVDNALASWCNYVYFDKQKAKTALFQIDLSGDTCARYINDEASKESVRYIDTSELITKISAVVEQGDIKLDLLVPDKMDAYLVKHLVNCLDKHLKRECYRSNVQDNVEICIGFEAAHFYCGGEKSLTDSFSDIGVNELICDSAEEQNEDYVSHSVELKNMGSGGLCLRWNKTLPASVNVGELVSVRFKNGTDWLIGEIRWINVYSSQRVEIGVSVFSAEIEIGFVRSSNSDITGESFKRAILLPSIECSRTDTIILPRNSLYSETTIEAYFANKKGRFNLQLTPNSTRGFEQLSLVRFKDKSDDS